MTETLPTNCDGCGAPVTRWLPTEPPNHGLAFSLTGSYSGFTDLFFNDDADHQFYERIDLCHDCVLRLVELFPVLRLKLGVACHPCDDSTPCCAYAWQSVGDNENVNIPNADLSGWLTVPTASLKERFA